MTQKSIIIYKFQLVVVIEDISNLYPYDAVDKRLFATIKGLIMT